MRSITFDGTQNTELGTQSRVSTYNRVVVSSGAPSITVGRTELIEPPGGTHTTTDLYSKLSADLPRRDGQAEGITEI